ncbi:MAG: DUF4238 domain-containing protein [Alphaproteobacteria bacterium]|nr:DUF4238 domain-containing protein [Alphaproteobacteria bacterium]MCW5741585.1 DUF4238 domain-containing protein [Alphaproteobacteria bacterium]
MSEPKRHHYIPVFYLTPWAQRRGELYEFSKPYKRVVGKWRHPKATGYKVGLYTMPGVPPEHAQEIEKRLMGMTDGSAAQAHRILLSANTAEPYMSAELRFAWARFIYALIFRSPHYLDRIRASYAEDAARLVDSYSDLYDSLRAPTDPATFEEFRAGFLANPRNLTPLNVLRALILGGDGPLHISAMHYRVFQLPSSVKRSFLTSDRPIIMTNGLTKPEGHIIVPLSPTALFVADNTDRAFKYVRSLSPPTLIRHVNKQVAEQSHQLVYSRDESPLQFITPLLGKGVKATPVG